MSTDKSFARTWVTMLGKYAPWENEFSTQQLWLLAYSHHAIYFQWLCDRMGQYEPNKGILLSLECWCLEGYFPLNFEIAHVQVLCLFQKEQNAKSLTYGIPLLDMPQWRSLKLSSINNPGAPNIPNSPQRTGACCNRIHQSQSYPSLQLEVHRRSLPSQFQDPAGVYPLARTPWVFLAHPKKWRFRPSTDFNGTFPTQEPKKSDKKQPCGRKWGICLTSSWFMCDSLSYWRENRSQHRKIPRFSFCDSWYWGLFDYRDSSNDCGNESKGKVAALEKDHHVKQNFARHGLSLPLGTLFRQRWFCLVHTYHIYVYYIYTIDCQQETPGSGMAGMAVKSIDFYFKKNQIAVLCTKSYHHHIPRIKVVAVGIGTALTHGTQFLFNNWSPGKTMDFLMFLMSLKRRSFFWVELFFGNKTDKHKYKYLRYLRFRNEINVLYKSWCVCTSLAEAETSYQKWDAQSTAKDKSAHR